ncbi:MAG: hypothetical protein H6760_00600 [Candidatus Nomurabacteria bacterium]|nr:MAG: hypothetical protein H6760_00600 [Candidatus Nomurabacteria bacterium]
MSHFSPSQYLQHRLESCGHYELTASDHVLLKEKGMEEFLYAKLTSKKFRKWRIQESYQKEIREQIRYCVEKNIPIEPTWFFGGYKLWSLPGSPEPNWAEFFTIAYFLQFISPIAAAYSPGVTFKFWVAHASIMLQQSNIPIKECIKYREEFNRLLSFFRKYLPSNIVVELHDYSELYPDQNEYEQELEQCILNTERKYHEEWTEDRKRIKRTTSELNIQWSGAEDWTKLGESEREEKIFRGPLVHDGYCALSRVNEALRGSGKLDLSATPLPSGSIPVGTSASSVTKFWTGVGVLEKHDSRYVERILSPQQWNAVQGLSVQIEAIDWLPMKNFHEIQVYPELNFSR